MQATRTLTTMLYFSNRSRLKWQSKGISVVDFVIFILWYLIGLHGQIKETIRDWMRNGQLQQQQYNVIGLRRVQASKYEKCAHVIYSLIASCSHRTIHWLHVIMKFTFFLRRHCGKIEMRDTFNRNQSDDRFYRTWSHTHYLNKKLRAFHLLN